MHAAEAPQVQVAANDMAHRPMQMSSDGAWSWHPEHVKIGQVVLGPTYRLMKLDTVIEAEDVRIFVDCTSGARLCKHGELGTTISTWKTLEAAAARDGKPPPVRKSNIRVSKM